MNAIEEKTNDALIVKLLKLQDDRGSISHLKRFWSPATLHYAYPILGRLPLSDFKRKDPITAWPDAITAALFAVHPKHQLGGMSIGKAALSLGDRKEDKHPYDSHFRRLLACESLEEVSKQLLKLLRRLDRDREGHPLDYNQVMWDLRNWEKESDKVKTRWAMHFWNTPLE